MTVIGQKMSLKLSTGQEFCLAAGALSRTCQQRVRQRCCLMFV